jgi:hypothetical protein
VVENPRPSRLAFQGPLRIPNLLREMAEVGSRRRAAIAREAGLCVGHSAFVIDWVPGSKGPLLGPLRPAEPCEIATRLAVQPVIGDTNA